MLCLVTTDGPPRYLTTGAVDPVTTRFRLGSITKLVTALTVCALECAGRLTLDAPLSSSTAITLRHLLTHTAGLPDENLPTVDTLPASLAMNWLPPGSVFSYSNLGFRAIETWLEELTARPLHALVRQHILTPYGMTTAVLDDKLGAAGGLAGTAEDAARLVEGLLRQPAHLAALRKAAVPVPSRPGTVAGLGCFQRRRGQVWLVEHEALIHDDACVVCLVPDEGWGYALLTRAWQRSLRQAVEQFEVTWFGPSPDKPHRRLTRIPRDWYARYVGEYVNGAQRLCIAVDGDELILMRQGIRVPLVQSTPHRLAVAVPLPNKPSEVVVLTDAAGQALCLYPFGSLRALRRVAHRLDEPV